MPNHAHTAEVVSAFASLVQPEIEDQCIDLLRSALTFARIEYPDLGMEDYAGRLEKLADRVSTQIPQTADALQSLAALNRIFFQEEGFRGNNSDYYDPKNSFLNDVLDRRLGIPISLSLVYMEIGRRVGFPLSGVGMPGHFLLKHSSAHGDTLLIDVFGGGRILSEDDCQARLDGIYKGQLKLQPEHLAPVTYRQMLTRMLNNLKAIYVERRDFRRALPVMDLILTIARTPEDLNQRAVLRYSLDDYAGAIRDFEGYLEMSPEAPDREGIRKTVLSLRRSLAMMN